MTSELNIKVEKHPPPAPKRKPPPAPPVMHYPFELIPVGGAARFPRSAHTVHNKLIAYRRLPGNSKQKFIIRPITPTACRVWRTA